MRRRQLLKLSKPRVIEKIEEPKEPDYKCPFCPYMTDEKKEMESHLRFVHLSVKRKNRYERLRHHANKDRQRTTQNRSDDTDTRRDPVGDSEL